MEVETLGNRINTESFSTQVGVFPAHVVLSLKSPTFSHASGSVPADITSQKHNAPFLTQVGFPQCKKDIAISGVFLLPIL